MSRSQQIRPSQFITTYGPGSILEGPDGPRIVPTLELSGVFGNDAPRGYAIPEPNLMRLLGGSVVRIPSNAERAVVDTSYIYSTLPFPGWSLCINHNMLYRHSYNQSSNTGCPHCPAHKHWAEAIVHARREAIRFVVACAAGHLDDVAWNDVIQHRMDKCRPDWLHWRRGGSTMEQVRLECPKCQGQGTLGTAYYRDWACSGRFPERRDHEPCRRTARMINRAAANLHLSELVSTVTIPRLDTRLHQTLAASQVLPMLQSLRSIGCNISAIRQQLMMLSSQGALPSAVATEVSAWSDDVLDRAVTEVLGTEFVQNESDVRDNEFRELHRAALHGHPTARRPDDPPTQFQVLKNDVRVIAGSCGHGLRVAPVSRLRVVMALKGYRRFGGPDADLVDVGWTQGAERWYPGVELLGEGVYIELAADQDESGIPHFPLMGTEAWKQAWNQTSDPGMHPVFVWWHTLAHRILNALALDSGYSTASIRERVFFNPDIPRGGILLYTVQPGGDGTLGGLIALVPRFDRILQGALATISLCSNDPLCGEARMGPRRLQGAICYACGLVSETSCEWHNWYLDRRALMANPL